MAVIYTYPLKSSPVDDDLLLISDSADENKTKRVTVDSIRGATVSGVSQIVAGTNVTISPPTGTGVVTVNASGGGTPGGSDTQIQYNNGGSFGGTTGLTWNDSTNILSIATRYEGDIDGAVLQQVLVKESGGVSKGDVVYISGGTGDNPEVMKARANSASTMAALGIMKENVALDAVGECVTSGEITGLNLTGFTTGDELFVSNTTAGELLTSAPTGEANLVQKIGKVIKGGTGGALTVLGAFRTNATPNLNQGSIFIGNASNQPSTLAIGTNGYVLTSNGTTASWAAASGYTLPLATSSVRGGVKIGYAQNARNYPVQLSSEQMFVNVPWTDTATSPSAPTNSVQFNSGSGFGGSINLTFSTDTLTLADTLEIKGDSSNPGTLKLYCENVATPHAVSILGPVHSGATTYEIRLPNTAPTSNQILQSSGTGQLSWINTPSDTNTNIANANLTLNADRTTSLDDYNLNISSNNAGAATGGIVRFQNYDSTSAGSPTAVRVDNNAQVDGQAYVTLHSGGTVTGNVSIDWNNGNVQELTLGGNINVTQANCKPGGTYILIVNQDAEALNTITWSTDFDWMDNNTAPGAITAARTDVYSFVCRTATSLLGTYAEDFIV
jgi:hypothetical protein